MDPYSVGPSLVKHLAKLAALELDPSEEAHFMEELNRILSHMKQLKTLDTDNLEATFQTFPSTNVTRKDEIADSLSLPRVLQNAPEKEGAFFKMPPILETDA